MERPFSVDEIKSVVFELGGNKVLGPDYFPLQFFKQSWEVIQGDLVNLCEDFYSRKANLQRINWASIVLIPKSQTELAPGDFRPISLINDSLKIISKLHASRLSKVMNGLVDNTQFAFIKGRCILYNIIIVEELIFRIHKHRLP